MPTLLWIALALLPGGTQLRIMPPDRAKFAVGQRFDIRVEATRKDGPPPTGLRVLLDGEDITAANTLPPPPRGNATSFLVRARELATAGAHQITAAIDDGASVCVQISAEPWPAPGSGPRAKTIILLLGDGMGLAHRTAARVLARGYTQGKPNGLLAMDTMEVTGLSMTSSLNALITDSAPGMSALSTGNKANNNQEGVFPDNTLDDSFDNPRVEYLGEFLRRKRGPGFHVGLVTTANVTDATPAANAVHTANRLAFPEIACRYVDERDTSAVSVLMGGGRRCFEPVPRGVQKERDLVAELGRAGFAFADNATELAALAKREDVTQLLGLFHPDDMSVAFDKLGWREGYSLELLGDDKAALRDQPMLDDMARVALGVLSRSSPDGFYLMIEGASIDKRAHHQDVERTVWDTIEFDRAVAVALEFARTTNTDADPDNDTLVVVTADHECGGLSLTGVGNEAYAPAHLGRAVRDYVATLRFKKEQNLELFPNYVPGPEGYPLDPDPTRKLIMTFATGPDHYENFLSNRRVRPAAIVVDGVAVANPKRDGPEQDPDPRSADGKPIPGFLVTGVIENGTDRHPAVHDDTSSAPWDQCNHTAIDVPVSASGTGASLFTGTFDNTEIFFKILRAARH
jgi:alkaline phosphatase